MCFAQVSDLRTAQGSTHVGLLRLCEGSGAKMTHSHGQPNGQYVHSHEGGQYVHSHEKGDTYLGWPPLTNVSRRSIDQSLYGKYGLGPAIEQELAYELASPDNESEEQS